MERRSRTVVLALLVALGPGGCTASPIGESPVVAGSRAASPAPAAPPSPSPSPTVPSPLKIGSEGPAVLELQQQLTALGYWLGTPDGKFGPVTQQAVFALQKVAGLHRTGVVNRATQSAIDAGERPTARSRSGRVIEVDLNRDVVMFVAGGRVTYTLNASTGGGYVYYDQGQREVAITPRGHFSTYRVIDGLHQSPLGLMFRPRYFTGGFAIHGDSYVPARPVSHGCVRISNAAIDWVWTQNLDPIGTHVWIY